TLDDRPEGKTSVAGQTLTANVPVDFKLLPGRYNLNVTKDGYEPFHTLLVFTPDKEPDPINAKLQSRSLFRKPWFWIAAGSAVTPIASGVVAYLVFKPDDFNGGSTGLVIDPSKK